MPLLFRYPSMNLTLAGTNRYRSFTGKALPRRVVFSGVCTKI